MFTLKYFDKIRFMQRARDNKTHASSFRFEDLGRRGRLGRATAPLLLWLIHAVFWFLRKYKPVCKIGRLVIVSRYADVVSVLERDDDFRIPFGPEMKELAGGHDFMLGLDGPQHQQQRCQVEPVLEPQDVASESGRLARLLINGSGGRIDVMGDLVSRVIVETCRDYFGLKIDDPDAFAEWTMSLSALLFADPFGNPKTRQLALAGAARIRAVARQAIARAGAGNNDTLIGRLVKARVQPDAIVASVVGLVTGFVPTTTLAAGKILEELLRRPEAWQAARDAAQLPQRQKGKAGAAPGNGALEKCLLEALRLNPALALGQWRYAPAPCRIGNTAIRANSVLLVSTMSAMRERRAGLENPTAFVPDRDPDAAELNFGLGSHLCFGREMAVKQIVAIFGELLALPELTRCPGASGRFDWIAPFPRRLDMRFKPAEPSGIQTMLTVFAPVAPSKEAEVLMKIKALGNPAKPQVASALEGSGIHFASMSAVRCGDERNPAAYVLLEVNADGEPDDVIDRVARDAAPWLEPIFDHVAGGDTSLVAKLARYRLRLRARPWGTTGLDFNGTPEFSVSDIEKQARLSAFCRDALDLYLKDQAGFGSRAMQAVDYVRDFIWKDPKQPDLIPNEVFQVWSQGKQFRDFLIRPNRRRPLISRWRDRTANEALVAFLGSGMALGTLFVLGALFLALSLVLFQTVSSQHQLGAIGSVVLALLGSFFAIVFVIAAAAAAFVAVLRSHEASDQPLDDDPDLQKVGEIARSENPPGFLQNHITALTSLKPGAFRRITLALALWGIARLKEHWFRPGFVLNMGTIHYAKWFRAPGTDQLVFLASYDGSWESYLEDFITKAHPGQTAVWSHGIGFPRTRFLIYDGARDGDRFKRWVRRQQLPTQFWYTRFPQATADQIRTNALIHDGLMRANTNSSARAWLDCFGSIPRPDYAIETQEVQSLVFRGYHPLHYAACAVLQFPQSGALPDDWLKALIQDPLEGRAATHVDFGDTRTDASGRKSATFVAFSARGLRKLGPPQGDGPCWMDSFPSAFNLGMASRSRILGDVGSADPQHWEWRDGLVSAAPHDDAADAVILVYGKSIGICEEVLGRHLQLLGKKAIVLGQTMTAPIAAPQGDGEKCSIDYEPFGFRDGISQPIIRGTRRFSKDAESRDVVEPGEFILGYRNHQGYFPPTAMVDISTDHLARLASAADVLPLRFPDFIAGNASSRRDFGRNGSFLVIRKLSQDVEGFKQFTDDAAKQLNSASGLPNLVGTITAEWVAAKMLGRWRDGTPLIPNVAPGVRGGRRTPGNDFDYGMDDPQGLHCPFGAHIRRANPRDSLDPGSKVQLEITSRHRMLRRGRPYEAKDGKKPGLLFICLCADLERQFELVQQSWINSRAFHGLENEPDPIAAPCQGAASRNFTIPTAAGGLRLRGLKSFVSVEAGGYFFLPSRSAFQYLVDLSVGRPPQADDPIHVNAHFVTGQHPRQPDLSVS